MAGSAKERICDAAIELLARKPLEDICVKELVATAQVSRSIYYYYFRDPSEVVSYLIERYCAGVTGLFDEVVAMNSGDPHLASDALAEFSLKIYEYIYGQRAMASALMGSGYRAQFESALVDNMTNNLKRLLYFVDEEGKGLKRMPQDDYWELFNRMMAYESWVVVEFWYDNGFELSPEEILQRAVRVLGFSAEHLSVRSRGNVPIMVFTPRRRA